MRLLRATINGFGKWVDETINLENKSFVCLYGGNEAGKSTLQQFILFMLFGFPPKRRMLYRPKTSSRTGGRLLVLDERFGEFTIERFDEVRNGQALCYTSDGKEHTEKWLKECLHGMTYETYQSVFSFSAMDLSDIQTMSEADLGDVLLSIGLTGSKNILSIEKELDNQMGNLFKPFGKKPVMNQQLETLDQLLQLLANHKNDVDIYRSKKMHIDYLCERMESLQEQYAKEEKACRLLEKNNQALPMIEEYRYIDEQLDQYPDPLPFPEDGLKRLKQLDDKILPLKSELTVLKDNLKSYNEKQRALKQQLYNESVYIQMETLFSTKQTYMANQRDLQLLRETIEKGQLQLQAELEQLEVGLTMEAMGDMSFPFHLERRWNELKQISEQLHLEREQLEDELFLLKEKKDSLTADEKNLKKSIPDKASIISLSDKIETYHRQNDIHRQSDNSEDNKSMWQQIAKKRKRQSKIILTTSVILTILFAAFAMFENTSDTFFIVSFFILIAGLGQWIGQNRSVKSLSPLFADKKQTPVVSITKEEKEHAAQKLLDIQEKQQALHTLSNNKKTLEIQMLQCEEKELGLQAKESRYMNQLEEQYRLYPFLKEIHVSYWPELFQKLKNIQHFYKKQIEQKGDLTKLENIQDGLVKELAQFFEHREIAYEEQVESQYNLLGEYLEQRQATLSRIKQFDEWMEKNKRSQKEINHRLMIFGREVESLFHHANVHTSDEFYAQANKVENKESYKTRKDQLEYQITSILTQTEFKRMLMQVIGSVDLQENIKETKQRMDQLTQQIEELRQDLANERAKLANMETSDDYSATTHRFQMEQEKLKKWAHEWSVLKTAKEMLIETKRIFRDKYLYKVIEKTSRYFSVLTNGYYTRIFAPSKNTLFQVESVDLIRYNVRELSKGTIDQLYISLRMAISEVLSKDLSIPFVIDDAFVHFDAVRTERMIDILSELAEKQQIIIFTNNEDIPRLAKSCHRIDLTEPVRIKG